MPIQIQAPDGSIAEFPDGTPDATITSVMAKTYGGPKTQPSGGQNLQSMVAQGIGAVSPTQRRANADAQRRASSTPGLVRSLNNGFLFNAAGNLDALGAAAETGIHNAFAHATGQPDSGYGMGEAFNAVRGAEANATNAFAQAHPVRNVAANIAGAVANPVNKLAASYVGRAGSLGGAVARSAATGGGIGAAYGAGGTQPGQSVTQNAQQGAAIGAATGAAAPVVARAAGAVVGGASRALGRGQPNSQPVVDALRQAKTAAYQAVDDMGVAYSPDAAKSLASGITDELSAANISPARHPKAFSMLQDVQSRLNSGQPITLTDLDQLRQVVSRDVAGLRGPDNAAERFMGRKIISNIDEFVDSAGPEQMINGDAQDAASAIAKARDLNARYRKVSTVQDAVDSAKLRAASTGSGGNANNAIRQNLRRFIDPTSGKRIQNLTPDEQNALQTAVTGTQTQNLLRQVGKLSPEGNGLMMAGQLGAGLVSHGASVPVAIAGLVAKHIADASTQQNVSKLITLMAQGAPGETTNAERQLALMASKNPSVAAVYREVMSRLRSAAPAVTTMETANGRMPAPQGSPGS